MASYSEEPPSMSVRMPSTIFFIRGFLCPLPMMSSAETIGTPDFIMVAICRLKKAMSLAPTALPAAPNNGFGLAFTCPGLIPWRRSSARSRLAFFANCSPFILIPRLSVPSQTNGCSSVVLRATGSFLIALRLIDISAPQDPPSPGGRLAVDGSGFAPVWAVGRRPIMRNRAGCRPKVTHCVTLPRPSQIRIQGFPSVK